MKNQLRSIIFLSSFFYAKCVGAQDMRYEFDMAYGRVATFGFVNMNAEINNNYVPDKSSGAFIVSSKYYLSHKFTVGVSIAVQNETGTWGPMFFDPPQPGAPMRKGTYKQLMYSMAPEVSYTYADMPKGFERLYATAGIGVTYVNEVDTYDPAYYEYAYKNGVTTLGNKMEVANNKLHLNGYVSPIGMRVGRALSAFLEVGYGYKGILNGGLAYQIKKHTTVTGQK